MRKPAGCKECPLYKIGQGFVPDELVDNPVLEVILEAPGRTEVEKGRPACGKAGGWLDYNILANAGLNRSQVSVHNTLRCLPPKNKAQEAYPTGKIKTAAEECCRQYDSLPRKAPVLLMGGKAMECYLGYKNVTEWCGHIEERGGMGGRMWGVTFHPSAVMRQPNLLTVAVANITQLLAASKDPTLLSYPDVRKEPVAPDLLGPTVFDLEWDDKDVVTVVGVANSPALSASSYGVSGSTTWLRNRLLHPRPQEPLIGHNIIKADLPHLLTRNEMRDFIKTPSIIRGILDTRIMAHLVFPHLASLGLYKLRSLASMFHPIRNWKRDTEDVLEYNGRDCAYNYLLYQFLKQLIDRDNLWELLWQEQEEAFVSLLMERQPIHIDSQFVQKHTEKARQIKEEYKAKLPFNPNSPKQVIQWGKENKIRLANGQSDYLSKKRGLHPTLDILIDYKEMLLKPIKGWFPVGQSEIHAEWDAAGTAVARWTSNPNMQNLPPVYREAIVAGSPESILFAADFSQIENRAVALAADDDTMLADFESGKDIHSVTATRIYHIPPEQFTPGKGGHRDIAKTVVHASNYVETPRNLARRLGISEQEAGKLQDTYFGEYHKTRQWQQNMELMLTEGKELTNFYGRTRLILAHGPHERTKRGCHFIGCSSAADYVNQKLIRVYKELGMIPILYVHDELVYEIAYGGAIIIRRLREIIESGVMRNPVTGRELKVPANYKIGKNYKDMEDLQ